ncbi:MAG: dynamin family protein [Pseudomonadota bacterium]
MLGGTPTPIDSRLDSLEKHLKRENPALLDVVRSYRELDKVAYALGIIERNDSLATRVPWWPLIAVLGTFSSGKSTFINRYVGDTLQQTGNQAVDDKFTVICQAADGESRTLPGLALDADPRFPFYQISKDIDEVASGEGHRVDAYLQLKTTPSPTLKNKIVIDSPGFDADAQRTSTLRITEHIIKLSDLVLVFFDARHPEPGAMQDTLKHLVADTINRPDSNKFLYVLNQIDNTAREDNPEEVFAAWQRGLAQTGLTAGRFYRIYDAKSAVPIEDDSVRQRFEEKRDQDLGEIHGRMEQVEMERAYRVVGVLEKLAKRIESDVVPKVTEIKQRIKQRVLWGDGIVAALLAGAGAAVVLQFDLDVNLLSDPWVGGPVALAVVALLGYLHLKLRDLVFGRELKKLERDADAEMGEWLRGALLRNASRWRSVLFTNPAGWGAAARRRTAQVLRDADGYVQTLNDRYANPSGNNPMSDPVEPAEVDAVPAPPTPDKTAA